MTVFLLAQNTREATRYALRGIHKWGFGGVLFLDAPHVLHGKQFDKNDLYLKCGDWDLRPHREILRIEGIMADLMAHVEKPFVGQWRELAYRPDIPREWWKPESA